MTDIALNHNFLANASRFTFKDGGGATWSFDTATNELSVALSVSAGSVADDAITNAKLANMAQATFKMRAAGAGTGDPIDGTAAQAKTALALVAADVSDFNEAAEDAVLGASANTSSITISYNDAGNSWSASVVTSWSPSWSGTHTFGVPIVVTGTAAAAVAVGFPSDPDTGLYSSATDTVNLAAGGAEMVRCTNTSSTTKHVILQGAIRFGAVASPTQLTANTDNWAFTSNETTAIIRVDASTPLNITGINGPTLIGRLVLLSNVSASTITLVHDATSTAANRFLCPNGANYSLRPNASVWIWYDATSARWRVVAA